jgi:hypothetical protein
VVMAWTVVGATCLILGSAAQILLWKRLGDDRLAALGRHSFLWGLYLLLGMFAGEHLLKWMKK